MKHKGFASSVKYNMTDNRIKFFCPGIDKTEKEAAAAFNNFLSQVSNGSHVFLHVYRLSDLQGIIDLKTIKQCKEDSGAFYHSYFYLSEAKVKSENFSEDACCELQFYFCGRDVEWEDFLEFYARKEKSGLFENDLLSAVFYICDHGADFAFEGSSGYKEQVLRLFHDLRSIGWKVEQSKITFPD